MEKKMNPIDRSIKEKLEGLQVPFDADSWQLMEQKLDEEAMGIAGEGQPVADTKHIDEAVFEKLHRYRAPYQPGHWQRMETLLDEAFAWPRQVLRYKVTELALMLLLFLLLWQYGSDSSLNGLPSSATPPTPEIAPASQPETPGLEPAIMAPQATLPNNASSPQAAALPKNSPLTSKPGVQDRKGGNGATPGGKTIPQDSFQSANSALIADSDANENQWRRFLPLPPASQRLPLLDAPKYLLPNKSAFSPNLLAELDLLEILLPAELAYDGLKDIGDATFTKSRNRAAIRVGMFGSAEYNHITVPSSEEKKLAEELQRYAMGYGGGLSMGFELGRFEIETGAIYAARQYPVGLLYVNGSVGSGLQGQRLEASELNIINVPLHFRYSFLSRGSWRAYVLAGASLQVAFQRNYYITDEPQYDFRPMQPPPMPAPSSGDEPAIDRIRKSGLGWFEGGTFEENAYLTGNLGLGLERYINARWSLFFQPTYQHSLQYFRVGLGPNADQINSLSFLFGAKVRVK